MWIHWSRGGGGEVYSHWNEEENTAAECGAFCCCFCFQPLSICHSPNHFCQGTGNFISRPEAIKSVCKTFCVLVYSVLLIKFPSAAVTLSTNPPRLHWEEKHIIAHTVWSQVLSGVRTSAPSRHQRHQVHFTNNLFFFPFFFLFESVKKKSKTCQSSPIKWWENLPRGCLIY